MKTPEIVPVVCQGTVWSVQTWLVWSIVHKPLYDMTVVFRVLSDQDVNAATMFSLN